MEQARAVSVNAPYCPHCGAAIGKHLFGEPCQHCGEPVTELNATLETLRRDLEGVNKRRDELIEQRRKMIVKAKDEGMTYRDLAKQLGVSWEWVRQIDKHRRRQMKAGL